MRRLPTACAICVFLTAVALTACTASGPDDANTPLRDPTQTSSAPPVYDAEIQVGAEPGYATVGAGSVWVGNHLEGTVSRIDPKQDTVIATIEVDGEPTGMLFAFDDVWTFGAATGLLHRIDPKTEKVVARVRLKGLGGGINGLAADDSSVWVSESSGLVYRIDPITDKVAGTVKVLKNGCAPGGNLTFTAGAVWYACWDYPWLWKIDPATQRIVEKFRVGGMVGSPAADEGMVWVPQMDTGWVLGIDPTTGEVKRRVNVGTQVEQVRVAGKTMWARVSATELAKVDLRQMKVVDSYELPDAPIPGGGLTVGFGSVWVVNFGAGTVWRINTG